MNFVKNIKVALINLGGNFVAEVTVPEMAFSWAAPELNLRVYRVVLKYQDRYFYYNSIQTAAPNAGRPIFKEAVMTEVK